VPKGNDLARPQKISDEELVTEAMRLQEENPLFSEAAICGLLRVGREYIADRAKLSPSVKETREIMAAIRQGAWEQVGIEMIKRPAQMSNPVAFIWQTRNILGWRNDPVQSDQEAPKLEDKGVRLRYRIDDEAKKR
jgi:hypothetical protein